MVILPDSLGPRKTKHICTKETRQRVPRPTLITDAYDANTYLSKLPYVDKTRIAFVGWSTGGTTVIHALGPYHLAYQNPSPGQDVVKFSHGVAFYPWCWGKRNSIFYAPLLILAGDKDDWGSEVCGDNLGNRRTDKIPVEVVYYKGAYHGFDAPGKLRTYRGHKVGYNKAAHQDSIKRVKAFLEAKTIIISTEAAALWICKATSTTGPHWGRGWNISKTAASQRAMFECIKRGGGCRVTSCKPPQ